MTFLVTCCFLSFYNQGKLLLLCNKLYLSQTWETFVRNFREQRLNGLVQDIPVNLIQENELVIYPLRGRTTSSSSN